MNFLFPAMLAGLGALSLPIILHLIARQKFPIQDFPTIRLLEGERRMNTLAPRLVDVWQLLLRLLVITLLVLAMARLFAPWLSKSPATHNVVIVIDSSAGMTQLVDQPGKGKISVFDLAKQRATSILNDVNAPSRASVIVAGGATTIAAPLEPGHDHALSALNSVRPYDASGVGLVDSVARACDMLRGRREISSQIIVLTNMHASSLDYRGQRDLERIAAARADLGDSLHLLFVDLAPAATENLGITNAYVRGRTVRVGADAHVISTITNTGQHEQSTKVAVAIGEKKEPVTKSIKIAPGSSAVVDLTARISRAMRAFVKVSIDEDSYTADDQFSVPLPVVDSRRVLIINGRSQAASPAGGAGALSGSSPSDAKAGASHESDIDGATILRFVLNPGRELGGTSNSGIDPVMISPEAIAVQPLSKYEIVVLYDVSSLPDAAMGDLATFVAEGKSLLIVCSANVSAMRFNRSLTVAVGDRPALAPAEVGNDIEATTPLDISLKDFSHPILSAFSDARHGDLSVIRFQKIRGLQRIFDGAKVILQTTAQQPLAIEKPLGRGRVVMLTFGFELDRGNIARTRVFPPLVWRIVDYLTGQLKTLPPDQLVARTPAALDVSETNFSLTSDLELTSAAAASATAPSTMSDSVKLAASSDRTVLVEGLAPGRYLLQKARAPGEKVQNVLYARGVTVSADPRQSDMTRISPDELKRVFGPQAQIVTGDLPTHLVPTGGEFWKLFVAALLLAYAAEAIFGFIASARRERARAPVEAEEVLA